MLVSGVAVATSAALALGVAVRFGFSPTRWLWARGYDPSDRAPITAESDATQGLALIPVAQGLTQPVDIQFVPGRSGLAVVAEKGGLARLVDLSGAHEVRPALAQAGASVLQVEVTTKSELGLLGIVFHPDYATNGRVFINYNPKQEPLRTVVEEWRLPAAQLGQAPATRVKTVLEVGQPYANHNAGQLAFGPDGLLYIGLGDGGAGGDPHGHGQNLSTLLGSMLRIDVNNTDGKPYAVPASNPLLNRKDARPEIWAYGLRNPWRYSFDPKGRLIVADVGQNLYEEVNVVQAGDNLGWRTREAAHCFEPGLMCNSHGLVDPIFEYGRDLGSSITGGYLVTGSLAPSLRGRYVFGDFASGHIWSLRLPDALGALVPAQLHGQWKMLISTFGRDQQGEVYVADFDTGTIFRIGEIGAVGAAPPNAPAK